MEEKKMAISAKLVKELREKTGAGMMDCKKALEACDGDIEASFDWLRENQPSFFHFSWKIRITFAG